MENLKNIKAIVFDFDETLYSGGDWSRFKDYLLQMLVDAKICKDISQAKHKVFEEKRQSQDIVLKVWEVIEEKQNAGEIFRNYFENKPYDIKTWTGKIVDNKLLKELSRNYKLFVLSDNSKSYLQMHMKKMGIETSVFEKIYGNQFFDEDPTKTYFMNEIANSFGFQKKEVLMIGDSEVFDIQAAERTGIRHCLVHSVLDTERIINALINEKI